MYRQFHLQKTIELYSVRSLEAFLFEMNRDISGNSIDLILVSECPLSVKVHSLNSGKVAATPILKSIPSQFSPFIL